MARQVISRLLLAGAFSLAIVQANATNVGDPSVGTNGATGPASSTQVGCIDGSAHLQPASATNPCPMHDASTSSVDTKLGEVQASPTANTLLDRLKAIKTSVDSLLTSLGTIATNSGTQATASKQDTGNTSLGSIDTKASTGNTNTGAIATSAASIDTKLSSQATATNQATANSSLSSILSKISADPATQTTLAAVLAKLTSDPATQTTLAAVLAKMSSDPATQTTLAAVLAKLSSDPATATNQASANTLLTAISGYLSTVANASSSAVTQIAATSTTAALQTGVTGNANGATISVDGMGTLVMSLNCANCSGGTTVNFEGEQDGTNYGAVSCSQLGANSPAATSTTTSGITLWRCTVTGLKLFRARTSNYSAGTVTANATAVPEGGGGSGSGTVTANAGTNLNTSALALDTSVGSTNTDLGAPGATACSTDTGSCSLNALIQRLAQRLTILNTTLGSPAQAGGAVSFSGYEFHVSDTPTVQNAAYASGNCMGGFQAIAAARTSGNSGILNTLSVMSKGGSVVSMQFYVFQQNPSSSTCTDKSTFTLNAADLPNLIATFALTPAAQLGTTVTYAELSSLARSFQTSGNANIYVAIVAGGAVTPASVSDLVINVNGPRD